MLHMIIKNHKKSSFRYFRSLIHFNLNKRNCVRECKRLGKSFFWWQFQHFINLCFMVVLWLSSLSREIQNFFFLLSKEIFHSQISMKSSPDNSTNEVTEMFFRREKIPLDKVKKESIEAIWNSIMINCSTLKFMIFGSPFLRHLHNVLLYLNRLAQLICDEYFITHLSFLAQNRGYEVPAVWYNEIKN